MTAFDATNLEAIRTSTEDISSTAEQFYKLYYDSVDTKRHLVSRLYLDSAVLVWNGNAYQNLPEIQKFYEQLPTTNHQILVIDSQLLSSSAVGSQKTLLIQTAGKVRIQDDEKITKPFQQVFIVTAQGDKWKIVSDCYRLQLPIDSLVVQDPRPEVQLQHLQLGGPPNTLTPPNNQLQLQQLQQQQIQQLQFQQQQQLQQDPQIYQQQLAEQQRIQQEQQQQLLQQQLAEQQRLQQLQQIQQQQQQQSQPQFVPPGFKF